MPPAFFILVFPSRAPAVDSSSNNNNYYYYYYYYNHGYRYHH